MKNIAIVGATGLVGEKLTALIDTLPHVRLRLFGNTAVGQTVRLRHGCATVEDCVSLSDIQPDYALFMAPNEVAARYIPKLVKKGVVCIDNSSHFRLKKDVPLVVSCINGVEARGKRLIANPNCSTIQTVVALNALMGLHPVKLTAIRQRRRQNGTGGLGTAARLRQTASLPSPDLRQPYTDDRGSAARRHHHRGTQIDG